MRILHRYLFRLYLPTFFLGLAVCIAVLLMNHFLRLFNLAVLKGISPAWIGLCFIRLLPSFLSLAVPMAFLVALLLVLGQLSENGEIMALRASGFSFRDILGPYLFLALALCGLLLYINHKASPEGYHSFKKSYELALRQVSSMDLEARTFVRLGEWELYAQGVEKKTGKLQGVYLVKQAGANRRLRVDAPEGLVLLKPGVGMTLELYRGSLQMPAEKPEQFVSASFERYRLFLPFAAPAGPERRLDLQEMNTMGLRRRLADPSLELDHRKEYTTEAALRTAGALSPFVLFWLGCPLGLRLERRARATGFALSLLVLFIYYGLIAVGIGLGRRQLALSPFSPWLPNLAGLAAGFWLWTRKLRT